MSRKRTRVPVHLNSGNIKKLPFSEIKIILRASDSIIFKGGRTLLAKILKGSREKKLLELHLDENPAYGKFKSLGIDEVHLKIDWMIEAGYLQIEYDNRLPLIVFTEFGWDIEKDTYSDELLEKFNEMIEKGEKHFNSNQLKDRNRQLIMMLLDKIEKSGDCKYIPILQEWEKIDYKKVRIRIRQIINSLRKAAETNNRRNKK